MSPWFARSAWLWTEASSPATPADLASFAVRNAVRDVWVSVPWEGPTRRTAAQVRALTGRGSRVACLGGEPEWATDAAPAVSWTRRAVASGMFARVHLDIEPWASPMWKTAPGALLDGLLHTVRAVSAEVDPMPVDIDLPAMLAREHPDAFTALLRVVDGLAIMAYRDRADAVLADAEAAVALASRRAKPFTVGVDTVPSPFPHTTFHDEGRDVLARQTAAVVAALADRPGFAGIAVHDLAAWRELRP